MIPCTTLTSAMLPRRKKTRGGGAKRARYTANPAKNKILEVQVASECPEENPQCTDMKTVRLFVVDRQQVWMCLDELEWAVSYVYKQFVLKGVPFVSPDSVGPTNV